MCEAGVDVQHLTIWAKLLKSMRILIRNDYLYTFTIKRFRMTSFCHAEAQGGGCVCQVWMFSILPFGQNCLKQGAF